MIQWLKFWHQHLVFHAYLGLALWERNINRPVQWPIKGHLYLFVAVFKSYQYWLTWMFVECILYVQICKTHLLFPHNLKHKSTFDNQIAYLGMYTQFWILSQANVVNRSRVQHQQPLVELAILVAVWTEESTGDALLCKWWPRGY